MPHATDSTTEVLIVAERPVDPQGLVSLLRERPQSPQSRVTR